MNKLSITIFLFGLCMFFTSCEKQIDIAFDFESKLVVNSIFSSDKNWQVDISNSRNILDLESSIDDVKDAVVTITDRESLEEITLYYSENSELYTYDQKPNPFGSYRIDVHHEDYTSAHSINDVPSKIQVVELDTSTIMYEGEETLKIDFNIVDDATEENFYVWDLVESDHEDITNILPNQSADLVSTDSNSEVITDQTQYSQSKIFIQDSNFNGTQYQTSFLSTKGRDSSQQSTDPQGNPQNVKLQLRILTVSKELFEYLKSVETFYRSNGSNTSSVNPVDIRSNIEGGLGIFGAYELALIDIN